MTDAQTHQHSIPGLDEELATATLKFDKTFRIAVTGDVFLTKQERLIVDTPDFQRLRGVRQLGTVNLVYPTALHTRFDHSLGTLAMADRMVMAIAQNAASSPPERQITMTQRKLIRLYALLHDIPHVPFGHTIEDELALYPRHDENPNRINHFLGSESQVGRLIREDKELGDSFYNRFMAIYLWEEDPKKREERKSSHDWSTLANWLELGQDDLFVHDIVSNTLCADLLDYIARDNYFCNLGIALEYRFLNFLYLKVSDQNDEARRRVFVRLWKGSNTPRRDILTDLTRLLEARYMLAERAYFHHTKLVTGAMLGRALQEYAAESNHESEEYLYCQSDDTLLQELAEQTNDGGVAKTLGGLLRQRKLYKMIWKFDDAAFSQAQESNHDKTFRDNALKLLGDRNGRKEIEDTFAEEIGESPGSVLIYAPPYTMNMKVAKVNVRWKGKDTILSEIDDPVVQPRLREILKAHQMLWGIWIIGTDKLIEEQKAMLLESFKLKFLVTENTQLERQEAHVERIIERQMVVQKIDVPHAMDVMKGRLRKEARELLMPATDKRPLRRRIDGAIKRIISMDDSLS